MGAPSALCGYGNSKIEILGSLELTVCYETLPLFVFHVAKKGANLKGLDLFTALEVHIGELREGCYSGCDYNLAATVASTVRRAGLPHHIQPSTTTAPLLQLLWNDEPWVWTQVCTEAVLTLKV